MSEMYFKFDREKNGIKVSEPFNRVITPIMTSDLTDRKIDFSVHMTEWDEGMKVDLHSHCDATEVMYCLEGDGIAMLEDKEYKFKPDSMICALPGMKHQIINTGKGVLKVLCMFSPPVSGKDLKDRAEKSIEEYRKGL